ncbi:MAG TPA: hypothetical protein VGG85_14840 [Terracidiphilus sp.]|jgi:hypothetical protein
MDFIERVFGVSPDGGNGSVESMYLAALLVLLLATVYVVSRRCENKQVRRIKSGNK